MNRALLILLLVLLQTFGLFADSPIPDFDFIVDTAGITMGTQSADAPGSDAPSSDAPGDQQTGGRQSAVTPDAPVYGVGADGGVWISFDAGKNWRDRSAGLPVRIVYPFDGSRMRRIESLSYDPLARERVAVTTAYRIYASDNAGADWIEVDISQPVKAVDHLTAVCISPHDRNTIYLGTSFNGLFKSTDFGKSWVSYKDTMQHLYLGAGFYETITAIAVSPEKPGHLLLAAGIHGEVFESPDGGKSWRSAGTPGGNPESANRSPGSATGTVRTISFVRDGEAWLPRADTSGGEVFLRGGDGTWMQADGRGLQVVDNQPSEARVLRRRASSGRTGIYVNSAWASGDKLEAHLELIANNGMDTIVVDMKDDFGRVTFDAENEPSAGIGSVAGIINLDELINRAHSAGIYVVGRIVVFQDPKLYTYKENAYAVWDAEAEKPWANMIRISGSEKEGDAKYEQREFWVDPHSEFVWRYNIAVAEELAARGVDEVQFDYIRFPSDGDTSRIHYRYRRDGMTRADAIESFLILARERLDIPISADLYGFNAWYLMGGWIGQNIDMVADYVDVICPMFYPSHFPGAFLSELDYFERAQMIYLEGSNRAVSFVGKRCGVRPYVQAFLIGAEREFESPAYTSYLARQLEGVIASQASGFTLWNASNIYYMVIDSLRRFAAEYRSQDFTLTD